MSLAFSFCKIGRPTRWGFAHFESVTLTVKSGPIHEKVSLENIDALCSGYFSGVSGTGGIVRPVKIVKSRWGDLPSADGVLFSDDMSVVYWLNGYTAAMELHFSLVVIK